MTELNALTDEETSALARMRQRESGRVRVIVTVSLPILVVMCIAMASSMDISSIYIVTGGVIAGLLLWGALINFLPLSEGSVAHRLLIEGDRTAAEEKLLVREHAAFTDNASNATDDAES